MSGCEISANVDIKIENRFRKHEILCFYFYFFHDLSVARFDEQK